MTRLQLKSASPLAPSTPFHGRPDKTPSFPLFHRPTTLFPTTSDMRMTAVHACHAATLPQPTRLACSPPSCVFRTRRALRLNCTTVRAARDHHAGLVHDQDLPFCLDTVPVVAPNNPPRVRLCILRTFRTRTSPPPFSLAGLHPLIRHKSGLKLLGRTATALRDTEPPATMPPHG